MPLIWLCQTRHTGNEALNGCVIIQFCWTLGLSFCELIYCVIDTMYSECDAMQNRMSPFSSTFSSAPQWILCRTIDTPIYIFIYLSYALAIVCICQKFSFFAQCVQKSINIYFIRRNSYSQTFQANKYFNVKCQCNATRQKHGAAAQNATTYRIHTYKVRETKQFPSDITTEKMNSN